MKIITTWIVALALALAILAPALADAAVQSKVYILNGYSLGGLHGAVDPAALEAKLGRKAGARITQADITADTAIVAAELKARHVEGRLATTLAEKRGRVWIIFDLLHPPEVNPGLHSGNARVAAQRFEGARQVSPEALAAASGLEPGARLTPRSLNAARKAILALYARTIPDAPVGLTLRIRTTASGQSTLTWVVAEPTPTK